MKVNSAIYTLRLRKRIGLDFGIIYLKQDSLTPRKHEHCQLRPAPPQNSDAFLYFTDLTTGEARQCRKRLIQKIRFREGEWEQIEI